MYQTRGFTLLELLITLSITCILLGIGIPNLTNLISKNQTHTAMNALLEAINTTRSTAVFSNNRTVLLAKDKQWENGWMLFVDENSNGLLDGDEKEISIHEPLKNVRISANKPVQHLISFISTGEGRNIGQANKGAFITGTIKICPEKYGEGYSLILSRGGRTRVARLKEQECASAKNA